MGSIYKITNTVNGKSYIGQTRNDAEKTRMRHHLSGNGNRLIKRAVKKYGQNAFTFEILHDGIIPEFLDTLEIEAIEMFKTLVPHGYNLTTGGESGSHSEVTKRKLSDFNRGIKHSEERRRKNSEAHKGEKNHNYGKKASEETRRKMSKNAPTKRPEVKRKISETLLGMSQEAFTILINQLLRDGWSQRKIARETRKSRRVIRKYTKLSKT